jgi:hypothetical protein
MVVVSVRPSVFPGAGPVGSLNGGVSAGGFYPGCLTEREGWDPIYHD